MSDSSVLKPVITRLQYWQGQLDRASQDNNSERIAECAKFVEEYGLLLHTMCEWLDAPPPTAPQGDTHTQH